MGEGYRTFDHTGDLGLEVWAESPTRLHALAAEALAAQIVQVPDAPREEALRREPVRLDLVLEGDDEEDLLVHWLNTVLLKGELERAVWTHVWVKSLSSRALTATLEGEVLDPDHHVRLREVKAVSFHDLLLVLDAGACRCRVILDI